MRQGIGNILHPASEKGQAATEFVVASVFILVPLFLIIPLLGKYIDIKHATIQRARYEAWEYTTWFGPKEYIMKGIKDKDNQYAVKKYETTQQEGQHYFFSDPFASTYGQPGAANPANPLWTDHRVTAPRPLITSTASSTLKETNTPDGAAGIIDTIVNFIGDVTKFIGKVLNLMHVDANFDAIYTGAYFRSTVSATVLSLDAVLPQPSLDGKRSNEAANPLIIESRAAVLSNDWSAGSRDNATSESRGLVFTSLLSPLSDTLNTSINKVQGVINSVSRILPVKIQLPYGPDFGYVKDDLIPFEHLEGNRKTLKDEHGLNYYE